MLLEVNHMSKKVKEFQLSNIDFQVDPGYIVGVIGKNGAGKTTLLNTILGLYGPDEGCIQVADCDRLKDTLQVKKNIAFVTDECLFPLNLSPKNIGTMFGTRYNNFEMDKFKHLCERFGVPFTKTLRKMSKGIKIKAQLAFAMSYDAVLYVFDEPTSGLDPVFRRELMDYFFELVSDGKRSILLSTQLTEELDQIADYILYLNKGKQEFFMDKETLQQQFKIVRGSSDQINYYRKRIVGLKSNSTMTEALVINNGEDFPVHVTVETPRIEDIMTYYEREKEGGN